MSNAKPSSVIDVHCHVIAQDTQRYPLAPLIGKQSDWSRERPVSCEQMIAEMAEAGVDKSSLVQASTCYGHDNSYVAASVSAHPERFSGVFSANLVEPDAIEKIRHWQSLGLNALRVFIAGHTQANDGARLDDPRAFAAWQYASDNRLPINVQLRADKLPQLVTLVEKFPEAVVVVDHFARPLVEDGAPFAAAGGLWALAKYRNVYFKYTTHNVRESAQGKSTHDDFAKRMVAEFGASRIAWGSNYPAAQGPLSKLLNDALAATQALSADDREWIFHRTARAIYPELGAA